MDADITRLLEAAGEGDKAAFDRLVPEVYGELRRMAEQLFRREAPEATLQPTALVHEAWIKLSEQERLGFRHRNQFFGAAGRAMRRILVDRARARKSDKRGGGAARTPLDETVEALEERIGDLGALDDALDALRAIDPRKAKLVELRFFVGLDMEAASEALGQSRRQTERDWTLVRAWLKDRLDPRASGDPPERAPGDDGIVPGDPSAS